MPNPDTRAVVTKDDVYHFLASAFHNIDLPALDKDDVQDIRKCLSDFLTNRLTAEARVSARVERLEKALRRIVDARSAMEGGSIAECRHLARTALNTGRLDREHPRKIRD